MATGTFTSALRADLVGTAAVGVPSDLAFVFPVAPVAISIPSLIVSIPRPRAGT
jgi:hypothetical protein